MNPFQTLVQYASDGMCFFDAAGRLSACNRQAETLLGFIPVVGQTYWPEILERFLPTPEAATPSSPLGVATAPRRVVLTPRIPVAGVPALEATLVWVSPPSQELAVYWQPAKIQDRLTEGFQHLFHSDLLGIFFFDLTGRLLDANACFLEMLGYSQTDLEAGVLSWRDLIQPEINNAATIRDELRIRRRVGPREIKYIRKDGTPILIAGSAALLPDGQTGLAVITDLREQQRLEEQRKRFILTASHELRTPITSLLVYLRFLQDSVNLNQEEQELLEIASRNVKRLTDLINTMMDVERLELGPGAIRRDRVDLVALVRQAARASAAEARHKGLQWVSVLPEASAAACVVLGDSDQLEKMITNLLANALKYTLAGGVTVQLARLPDGWVELRVQDTGVGIAPQDQSRIFEGFYRVPGEMKAKVPGSGLGLRIVKDVVEMHGGTLMLDSKPGQGSTFTVRLPSA